jgi:hypothetical protein
MALASVTREQFEIRSEVEVVHIPTGAVLSARQHRLLARAADLLQPNLTGDTSRREGSRVQPENWSDALDIFVARENITRYKKRMLEPPHDEATRQVLLQLLGEEERKLKRYLSLK